MRLFIVLVILLFYFSSIGWIWQDPVAKKNKEGVRLYNEGKVDDALSKWRDAQIDNPDKEELHYNIGGALYKQKKYEDSFNAYEKSLSSKDAELHEKTYYNMGNSFYRMGKLPEAIEYYKKALDINPDDKDAKYNIEFVRKKIKENLGKKETQQSQTQKQQQKQEKEGKGEDQRTQQGQEQESQQARVKEEEKKEGENKEEANKGQNEQKEIKKAEETDRGEESEMSKEDALRLLDALKDDEKDLQKELRTQPWEGTYKTEKDW